MARASLPLHRLKSYECYINYSCNRACRYCFVEKKSRAEYSRPPAFAELCRSIYEARAKGFDSLSLLGGEPTLYPDLDKLLKLSRKLGFRQNVLFTNGVRLADRDFLLRLREAGLDAVQLNIPSHREKVFAFLTRHPAGFPQVLRGLENLRSLGVPVTAICAVNRLNYKDLPAYAEFCFSYGIRALVLQYLKYQGNINPFTQPDNPDIGRLKVRMSACVPYVRKMAEYCLRSGHNPPFLQFMMPCVLKGLEPISMEFWSDLKERRGKDGCWHPDIKERSLFDVAYKERVMLPGCASCLYAGRCIGIDQNYLEVFGPSEFKPVKKAPRPFYEALKGRDFDITSTHLTRGAASARKRA